VCGDGAGACTADTNDVGDGRSTLRDHFDGAGGRSLSAGHIMLVASRELNKPLLPAVDQLGVTTKFGAGVASRRVFISG